MTAATGPNPLLRDALRHLERKETVAAENLLSRALAEAPDDVQALQLLGVVRRSQGRLEEAEDLYRRSLALDPNQPHVHHNLGNLLNALGRIDECIAEEREAIRLRPGYADARLGLAAALAEKGEHSAAETSYREVLRLQPNYLQAKLGLAVELCAVNRAPEAERLLRQTLMLGIRDQSLVASFEHNLGVALNLQSRFSEALKMFDQALADAPEMWAADFSRGGTLQQLGRYEEAAECYRRVLAREPAHVDALACLALILAHLGDFASARDCGAKACVLDPRHPIARIALAICAIEAGRFEAATQDLRDVFADPAITQNHAAAYAAGFAADAFDRHRRFSEAFEIYRASNERLRAFHAGEFERNRAITEARRLTGYFRKSAPWVARRAEHASSEARQHVFVLGFMRSGTTLLETILAMNPEVAHIDEIEFLTDAARAFLLSDADLDRLAALDPAECARWRESYWNSVRRAGHSVAGKCFVDKMPFNTIRLPLISRLFPNAKVIFASRDPRDVVLSCFRRRFNPGPYSFEFFRLDDCARFYSATMELAELYRAKLPLAIHEHRYEDMVADLESSVRAVCNFTGIAWLPAMRDFRGAAEEIDRRSASAAQVRRGLYREAVGQWRQYRDELAPVLPILAPWVARFGYSAD
jgi:tetratricopeptide (TPR) repeat protein